MRRFAPEPIQSGSLVPPLALARIQRDSACTVGANVAHAFDKVNAVNQTTPTPLGDHIREQARAHRATAAQQPDDPRYPRSADALEALADYADRAAAADQFQMRYLLKHHIVGGRFLWADGQCGRALQYYGFDEPVRDEFQHDLLLMDLCDLAKSDASRHIGSNESEFDRADAAAIAERFGIDVERVHHALDTGRRLPRLYVVGIPDWHPLTPETRGRLEEIDGAKLERGREDVYGEAPPLLVYNIPVGSEQEARELVAKIVGIDPAALGVNDTSRLP
ncbi:MAG: hypothetical protein QOD83_3376 [Solirubrobacteraceae bacterium]|jgi:hypothetical protein|nr:hypothetical protein [Solirubrobacteraceae bacterium]